MWEGVVGSEAPDERVGLVEVVGGGEDELLGRPAHVDGPPLGGKPNEPASLGVGEVTQSAPAVSALHLDGQPDVAPRAVEEHEVWEPWQKPERPKDASLGGRPLSAAREVGEVGESGAGAHGSVSPRDHGAVLLLLGQTESFFSMLFFRKFRI